LSADKSVIGGLAGRYGVALYELTQELPEADQAQVQSDVAALKTMIDDSADLQKLIKSPLINAAEQAGALDAVLEKAGAHQLVRNFAALVVAKRRAFALADMATQFSILAADARDEMRAYVTAAQELSAAQIDALKDELTKAFEKNVIVESQIDAALLGGMIVKVGSRMIDGSLKTKLNSLKASLNG
jgi:F-type H+-transporting ATPase subunit delta